MRRLVTWLLLTGLAAVVLTAAVDTLREHKASRDAPTPVTRATGPAGREDPRSSDVSGLLIYADERCRVFAIGLTALRPHVPSGARTCIFRLSPGNRLSFSPELPSPLGEVRARCRDGGVELLARARVVDRFAGCAPAWKPDGTLVTVDRGEAVAVSRCGAATPCAETILSPHDFGGLRVVAVAWITNADAAAILRESGGRHLLAVLEGKRMALRSPPFGRLSRLRASPTGRYAAARSDEPAGVVVLDRRLHSWSFLRRARAIAWPPDERLAAVATPDGIEIVGADRLDQKVSGLGFQAVDVAWR